MTGISQTPNQELRDVERRDNHRNSLTSMRLIVGDVKKKLFFFKKLSKRNELHILRNRLKEPSLPARPVLVC
jgi:hypothetical protein